jgi:hypothetical protein
MMDMHFVSKSCGGHRCRCGNPATHKVGEEIPWDDPAHAREAAKRGLLGQQRHNFTAYVCCECFRNIMGDAVFCPRYETDVPTKKWVVGPDGLEGRPCKICHEDPLTYSDGLCRKCRRSGGSDEHSEPVQEG